MGKAPGGGTRTHGAEMVKELPIVTANQTLGCHLIR
jgi:hypothetical protein